MVYVVNNTRNASATVTCALVLHGKWKKRKEGSKIGVALLKFFFL